jgi:hypothetical protein
LIHREMIVLFSKTVWSLSPTPKLTFRLRKDPLLFPFFLVKTPCRIPDRPASFGNSKKETPLFCFTIITKSHLDDAFYELH